MKIGYIATTYPCKSEVFAQREIESLSRFGFDISVFAATKQQPLRNNTKKAVFYKPSVFSQEAISSIIHVLIKYPLASGKLLILIIKLILVCPREALSVAKNLHTICSFTRNLDRLEIHHIHSYFLSWPAVIGMAISIVTGREFSISAHAKDIFVEQGAVKLKTSYARFISTCTQEGLENLKLVIPKKYHHKLYLNYHSIDTNYDSDDSRNKDNHKSHSEATVVAVGRFVPKKGFESLIKAFALLIEKTPYCKLVIAGEGEEAKKLTDLIKKFALNNNVKLTGWLPHDMTIQLIRQATILVAPSIIANDGDRDGIPNVILEAFANRTPVVASNLKSIREVIEHRKNGLLAEPGDIDDLALAIKELLFDKSLQNRFSRNAYETTKQQFNYEINTKQLASLFLNVN